MPWHWFQQHLRATALRPAAEPADADRVRDAALAIFGSTDMVLTQPDEFTVTVEEEAAILASRAGSATGLYLIAEVDGGNALEERATRGATIIAIAGLDPMVKRRAAHNVNLGIMVAPEWRGRGVGDALMGAVMAWARANPHIRRVQLEVVATNPGAIRLYERHGFVTEGRRIACFQRVPGVFEDDLIMACDVSFGKSPNQTGVGPV